MRRTLIALLLCLSSAAPAADGGGSPFFRNKSEAEVRKVLALAVTGVGESCVSPRSFEYMGLNRDGADYYLLHCAGGDFMVSIGRAGGGKTTVVNCAVVEALIPSFRCAEKWD